MVLCGVVVAWQRGVRESFIEAANADEPATEFPEPTDNQPLTVPKLEPAEALRRVTAPEGFHTSLFAAEPLVRQPISAAFDGRGRLWVAENYTYADSRVNFDLKLRDRIVILEDTDGDGRADRREVFWDGAQRLTSVELGFGGVWAMAPPNLLFLPDADGDDKPDGAPVVMLDGWDDSAARHNFTNGLHWGPDGWLYGRNGILATSQVGVPGTPLEQRLAMNCGVWRFHPTRRAFEVVCSGTTNPWGSDWDDRGQMFFINTVIGHLWHVVPGAHYRRMYGDDLNPHVYELIEQTADHVHWDEKNEEWTAQRKGVTPATDLAGGGHAHSGLMIYLGDNWPAEYRGDLFTVNLHGQRLNREALAREGATFVGRHRPDFWRSGDPWFRAIDLMYGPDGAVYLLDWSDIGECHENDGVDRSSGRIYKIAYRPADAAAMARPGQIDVGTASLDQLVAWQLHANDWFVRQARRGLQERAARGEDLSAVREPLRRILNTNADGTRRLRALWALHAAGGLETADLLGLLTDRDEALRVWAVQLLVDSPPSAESVAALVKLASQESSGLVLTFLASALQRLPLGQREALAGPLLRRDEWKTDRVYPLMAWYGVEELVGRDGEAALRLVRESRLPKVSRFIARRIASQLDVQPRSADGIVAFLKQHADPTTRREILGGLADGLRGWQRAAAPAGWTELAQAMAGDETAAVTLRELAVVFGDGRAIDDVKRIALSDSQPTPIRRQAMRSLTTAKAPGVAEVLLPLVVDRSLGDDAVRGLAAVDLTRYAPVFVEQYRRMYRPARLAAVESLALRRDTAQQLLVAVEREVVGRNEVAPFVLRQIQLLDDASLQEKVVRLWPELRLLGADRVAQIKSYREQLTDERLGQADLPRGRRLYDEACGKCHKLFGEGGTVGPELTGAQRGNLNYWLENMLDPSAVVADSFKMSIVELEDGRVLNGVVGAGRGPTFTLQTPTEKLTLERREVAKIRPSNLSLMPEGQLTRLSADEVRDLVAYLMSNRQVPRGAESGAGRRD